MIYKKRFTDRHIYQVYYHLAQRPPPIPIFTCRDNSDTSALLKLHLLNGLFLQPIGGM